MLHGGPYSSAFPVSNYLKVGAYNPIVQDSAGILYCWTVKTVPINYGTKKIKNHRKVIEQLAPIL